MDFFLVYKMEREVSAYLGPVSQSVGEFMTLEEMRAEGWKVPQKLLKTRLPLEYPTLEAMYRSGFPVSRSILKRHLTVDPTTIVRGHELTPEQIDSIAADILLYGVPDEYITNPKLYTGLSSWLRLLIIDTVIDDMSTDMLRTFFSSHAAPPGVFTPAMIKLNTDRKDIMPAIAKLLYKHKLLRKHRELLPIVFAHAVSAGMTRVIKGVLDAEYRPTVMELVQLAQFPNLFNRALDKITTWSIDEIIFLISELQSMGVKTPQLVKLFQNHRYELIEAVNQRIGRLRDNIVYLRRDLNTLESSGNRTRKSHAIRLTQAQIQAQEREIEHEQTRLNKMINYWM